MTGSEFPRVRLSLVTIGLSLLAMASAGCTQGDYGTVAATPKTAPEVGQVAPSGKDAPAPRVPRGPGQANALRDAKAK